MRVQKLKIFFPPFENIFLLSHMRSYSSLFGHILGSHSQINGYYESHQHYFSWKSYLKQRLTYIKNNELSQSHRYMFDKLLHDELIVDKNVLNNPNNKFIIMIREPEPSIKSIIKMAEGRNFDSPLKHIKNATNYYFTRLENLVNYSNILKNKFLFIDSEMLKINSDFTLQVITDYLSLKTDLKPDFQTFKHTTEEKFGDTSGNLNKGFIINSKSDDSNLTLSSLIPEIDRFKKLRMGIINNSLVSVSEDNQRDTDE